MRKFLLMSVMLVTTTFSVGCGLTVEQRQEVVDELSEIVTAKLADKTKEIAGNVTAKAVEAITKTATELGISEEKIKELGEKATARATEAVDKFVAEKLPAEVKKVVNDAVPEATESSGTGKGVAGFLYMAFQGLLGLGKKGILGGVA